MLDQASDLEATSKQHPLLRGRPRLRLSRRLRSRTSSGRNCRIHQRSDLCMRVRACACVRMCACACVRVCVHTRVLLLLCQQENVCSRLLATPPRVPWWPRGRGRGRGGECQERGLGAAPRRLSGRCGDGTQRPPRSGRSWGQAGGTGGSRGRELEQPWTGADVQSFLE